MEKGALLNKKQQEAVEYTEGPLLIIAGPGSGKTKTLVERVSYILNNKDVEPKNILLATFTEKASRELTTRVSEGLRADVNLSEMYLGTIHSICLRIIDENIEKSVLERNYRVLDDVGQRFFIFKHMKDFKKIDGYYEFLGKFEGRNTWGKVTLLKNWIDKINEIDISEKTIEKKFLEDIEFLRALHKKYVEFLFAENTLDFSNIQMECLRILRKNRDVLAKIREDIKYIMIDEYQDTNKVQENLFLLIAGERKNICVVGDDDQAIYRFRGATIKNILEFAKNFPEGECKKIEFDTNYRSNEDIVDFCNLWNEGLNWDNYRYDKKIVSGKDRVNKTLGVIKIAERSEHKWQVKLCKFVYFLKKIGRIEDYNEVAFLFRSVRSRKVLDLMEQMEVRGIPVYSPRSNMFFRRDEIKFIIGIFLMIFPQAKKLLKSDKYLNLGYYKMCYNYAKSVIRSDEPLIELMKEIRDDLTIYPSFLSIFYKLLRSNSESFNRFFNLENNHILFNRSTYNLGIFSKIVNDFDEICKVTEIGEENINMLVRYFFTKHLKFLKETGVSEFEDMREYAPKGAVSFLTIHQGKGLEFPCVIVGSLESKPTVQSETHQMTLENIFTVGYEPEYRRKEFDFWRTYYTAFSRAQNLLALTCVENSYSPIPSMPFKSVYEGLKDVSDDEFDFSELKFERVKEMKIKEKFAFTSHIALYTRDPKLYKLQKKFKFVPLKNKGMLFGSLVHETLEDINKIIFADDAVMIKEIGEIFERNYETLIKTQNIRLDKNVLEFGKNCVIDYYKTYDNLYDEIKDIEIKLSLIKEDYILEGIIDLVAEKDGEIEIIDFKTGKRGESESDYINQLEIYAYLLRGKYGKKIKKGKLYYLSEDEENKIVEINFTEERLEEAFARFDMVAKKILADDYELE